MFLVYIPILSVGLYYCSTRCIPDAARRVLSRVVSELVVTIVFTLARTARYAAALRSTYIWDKRTLLPTPLVNVLDALLKVDKKQALVDTSSGHSSIQVLTAISTVNSGPDYDITSVLGDMWAHGDGLRIIVPINLVLERLGVRDLGHDSTVVTRIRYRGHSNANKRYRSETFSVRYACELSQVFRFPPYPSSEKVRRGLGVPRIIRANFIQDNGRMLYGPEAKESSGLRRDFYATVDDDPCLLKNVVTFIDPIARFQEQKEVVVTTSKPDVNIFCNSSQVPS